MRLLRWLWWRIRLAVWQLAQRVRLAIAKWRTIQGVKVALEPTFDEEKNARALAGVEAALNLIAEHAPRRLGRIQRDIRFLWIRRTGYATAWFSADTRVCVLDRRYLTRSDTTPARIAATLIHEATHARLDALGLKYPEPLRARIEAICDAQAAEFVQRIPDGESVYRAIIDRRPTDPAPWSNEILGRQWKDARRIELESDREEVDGADMPAWQRRMFHRLIRRSAYSALRRGALIEQAPLYYGIHLVSDGARPGPYTDLLKAALDLIQVHAPVYLRWLQTRFRAIIVSKALLMSNVVSVDLRHAHLIVHPDLVRNTAREQLPILLVAGAIGGRLGRRFKGSKATLRRRRAMLEGAIAFGNRLPGSEQFVAVLERQLEKVNNHDPVRSSARHAGSPQ